MVKVEIVEEKDQDVGNSPYASPSSSRTSSSVSLSSAGSDLDNEESFYERLTALVDIVPPTTRQKISSRFARTASFFKSGSKVVGNIVWIVTTSALLVGLPLALSLEDEAKIVAQEKEQYAQQYGAQQVRGLQTLTACELPGMSAWLCPFIVTSPPPSCFTHAPSSDFTDGRTVIHVSCIVNLQSDPAEGHCSPRFLILPPRLSQRPSLHLCIIRYACCSLVNTPLLLLGKARFADRMPSRH